MKSKGFVLDLDNLSDQNIEQYGLIVENIRKDFNSLIESISRSNTNSYWLLSSVVSRESQYSPLFSRCCFLELIKLNVLSNHDLKKMLGLV